MVLLVVDTQKGIVDERLYAFEKFVSNIRKLIRTAREQGIEVVYVQMCIRDSLHSVRERVRVGVRPTQAGTQLSQPPGQGAVYGLPGAAAGRGYRFYAFCLPGGCGGMGQRTGCVGLWRIGRDVYKRQEYRSAPFSS